MGDPASGVHPLHSVADCAAAVRKAAGRTAHSVQHSVGRNAGQRVGILEDGRTAHDLRVGNQQVVDSSQVVGNRQAVDSSQQGQRQDTRRSPLESEQHSHAPVVDHNLVVEARHDPLPDHHIQVADNCLAVDSHLAGSAHCCHSPDKSSCFSHRASCCLPPTFNASLTCRLCLWLSSLL